MINVVLLGAGNVAYHLAKALMSAKNIQLIQRFRRNDSGDQHFDPDIPVSSNISELMPADVYIIAISDDAIASLSKSMVYLKGLVIHTSGSMPLSTLHKISRKGVLYPVQTFSMRHQIDFGTIPLAIEASSPEDYNLLEQLAKGLGNKVFKVNSEQREKLHIAAVFSNNFTNHLYLTAEDICKENGMSFTILKPLILETAKKIIDLDPLEAQTGPGKRNDNSVIEKHLNSLNGERKEIYKLLSNAISKRYQNKLNQ